MRRSSLRARTALLAAASAAGVLVDADRLSAVTVSLSFDAAASAAFNPSFDPTGAGLQAIMGHVAGRYGDIFETAHNLTLTYRWGDLPGTELVRHTLTTQAGGRQTAGTIVFDSRLLSGGAERLWFVDSTPSDNAEFNMSQTLFRNLTPTQQTTFFDFGAAVPSTFEVGFTGPAVASAPAAAQTGLDLLTYAFSGVGQALGMDPGNTATSAEIGGDADYDLDPVNVFGRTLALDVNSLSDALLLNDFSVQDSGIRASPGTVGTRRLPSHGDLLAMAAVHNYTQLDIPRREYYGATGSWNTPGNWVGNQVPGSNDEVFIRDTDNPAGIANVTLTAPAFAGAITVAETANLNTSTFTLNVGTLLTVRDLDSDLIVSNGGTVSIPNGTIQNLNNAEIRMNNGTVNAGTILNSAEIRGGGVINVGTLLRNNGVLVAEGNPLTIATSSAVPAVDLDGQGTFVDLDDGEVLVLGTTLTVPALTDTFTGTLSIGTGGTFNASAGWTLDDSTFGAGSILFGRRGVLSLGGGSTTVAAAKLTGGGFTSNGQVNVALGSMAQVLSDATFNSRSTVNVSGATLDLRGDTVLNGGSFIGGGGTLLFNGAVHVTADTIINVNNVDFDGEIANTVTTIDPGVKLELLTNNIDQFGSDSFNSTVNNNGGDLRVVTISPWGMAGSLNFTGGGTVQGSPALYTGTVTVNSGVASILPTGTFSGARVNLPLLSSGLILGGPATTLTLGGGTWTGNGAVTVNAGTTNVITNTTLGNQFVDLDGTAVGGVINVNPGVRFQINGNITDELSGTTLNLNSGTFIVLGSDPWANGGTILFNSVSDFSVINGQAFSNSGTIIFGGATSSVINATLLHSGTFAANQSGSLATAAFNSPGRVTIAGARELNVTNTATLNGGSFTGAGRIRFDGPVVVTSNTTIETAALDLDGLAAGAPMTVNAGAALTIEVDQLDDLDNTYDNPATVSGALLVNTLGPWRKATGTLTLHNSGAGVPTVGGQPVFLDTTLSATGGLSQFSAALRSDAGLVATGTINVGAGATLLQNGPFRVDSASAGFRKTGAGTLEVIGTQTHAVGGDLSVAGGTLVLGSDAGTGGPALDVTIETAGAAIYATRQHLNTHTLQGNARVRLAAAGPARALRVSTQTLDPTAQLDLTDNAFVQDHNGATPLATLRAQIGTAYNNGLWNGRGITSSLGDASSFGIGYAEAGDVFTVFPANFVGEQVDGSTALLRFTRYGDANLDGTVGIGDFANLASNFNTPGTWPRGDFNYDGQIGIADFSLLAANYNQAVPADLPRGSAVPEPGAIALAAMALLTPATRRRRR